jgi:hypothetical protein
MGQASGRLSIQAKAKRAKQLGLSVGYGLTVKWFSTLKAISKLPADRSRVKIDCRKVLVSDYQILIAHVQDEQV